MLIEIGVRGWCHRMVDLGGSDFSTQADRSRLLVGCKTWRESKVFFLILQRITALMCMRKQEFQFPSFTQIRVGKNSYLQFSPFITNSEDSGEEFLSSVLLIWFEVQTRGWQLRFLFNKTGICKRLQTIEV